MAFLPLDGPTLQASVLVTDVTVFRVRVGASELTERNVVTIQPLTGLIWVFFGDNVTIPTASEVRLQGFSQPKNSTRSYEATGTQEIYIVADTGTVDVRFAERG